MLSSWFLKIYMVLCLSATEYCMKALWRHSIEKEEEEEEEEKQQQQQQQLTNQQQQQQQQIINDNLFPNDHECATETPCKRRFCQAL